MQAGITEFTPILLNYTKDVLRYSAEIANAITYMAI